MDLFYSRLGARRSFPEAWASSTPPHRGVGVWRKKNARNRADNIPASKSGDWVAEKNSVKAAARFALSFSVTKTAKPDAIDFVFSKGDDAWVMPIETAGWLSSNLPMVKRFEDLLNEHGVAEEDFNAFLGHNWRYTMLEAEEIKVKFDAYIAQRDNAIDGAFEAKPVEEPAPEPAAAPAEKAAPEVVEATAEDTPETTEEPATAKTESGKPVQAEQPAIPTLFDTPTEAPAKKKKASTTRRQPVKSDDQPKCVKCEEAEPTNKEPFPFLCADCARAAGDEEAAQAA